MIFLLIFIKCVLLMQSIQLVNSFSSKTLEPNVLNLEERNWNTVFIKVMYIVNN